MRKFTILLVLALPACNSTPEPKSPAPPGQSFTTALTLMCDVDRQAGLAADTDSIGVGLKRSTWIAEKVDNPDGIELRTLMSVKGAADQAKMLRARAQEAGITTCALADKLETSGEGGLSP